MKLFFGFLSSIAADCIFAPGEFDLQHSRNSGPIFKLISSCTQDPIRDEDSGFWVLPEGSKCTKIMCQLKTGGNASKYRKSYSSQNVPESGNQTTKPV